ncbi:MAG: hypothetical protein ACRC1H_19245 [Caldilineaceae bacterium]
MIVVPIRTKPGQNAREHWCVRAKRVRHEREVTGWALAGATRPALPCVCTLTRLSPAAVPLDDDNLPGSCKAIRDAIADWLGVDDRHADIVRYEYAQQRAKEWGVGVEFRAMDR